LIEFLYFYQQLATVKTTPYKLFEKIPVLKFKAEQQVCPICTEPLHICKTSRRTIKSIGMGIFQAHHIILGCKRHPELGFYRSKELDELVAPNNNVAYNVIVEIGKLRFMENRQVNQILDILLKKHSVDLSTSEIELLIDKFVFYLAAVHQENIPLIKAEIKAQGGYILHLDATCEGDSPKLVSSVDSVSGFVLYSAKLTSENKDEIVTFLSQINNSFGRPHAIVSDMSKAIKAAVVEVFGDIPHYICHFHFLAAIGKLLFEKEHDALRKTLSKAGISGKLKILSRNIARNLETLSIDEIENYLASAEKLGKTPEATEMLAYYLILWILDHPSEGNGYGFPFDQRYLNFYQRLQEAQILLHKVKTYYSTKTDNDEIVWELYHLIQKVVGDSALKSTVTQYQTKLTLFTDLRQALAVAPESTSKGLRQNDEIISNQKLEKIKNAVEAFMRKLEDKIEMTTDKSLIASFTKVKERILEYWDRLFADPFVVEVNGEKRIFFIHRTNNIMEHQFRLFAYSYRRVHGNRSIRRNLENIPEALPLVANLKNPDYVKLVFKDESKIAKKFSEIDVNKIRAMFNEHHNNKKKRNLQIKKLILRHPQFKNQLKAAFAVVAR
jgi:uncharacterized protein YbaR (Trm112 family)